MRGRALFSLWLAAVVAAGACGGTAPDERGPAARAADPERDVDVFADQVMARAREAEPAVSGLLRAIAADVNGRLAGYEHRLKTRRSLLRKVHKILHDHPASPVSAVVIDDALRYTIEVDDVPPGAHAAAIRTALVRLEAAGHRVAEVKNYWPRGDNYSGVNSVLIAPGGLAWELQFHTAASFRLKTRDHHLYEEMRETTSAARRRKLYDELSGPWRSIPIPAHVLEPNRLHPHEKIILRPPPAP